MAYHLVDGARYYVRDGRYRPEPPVQVIDSFEDDSLSEYDVDTNVFYTTQWGEAVHGDHVLVSPAGATSTDLIGSMAGLPAYPAPGDTWEVFVRFDGLGDVSGHLFGVQDTSNVYTMLGDHYRIGFDTGTGDLGIWKAVNGTSTVRTTDVTWYADVWYRVRIEWAANGEVSVDAYRADSGAHVVSHARSGMTEFSGGGIGFWNASNTDYDHYYDYVHIPA